MCSGTILRSSCSGFKGESLLLMWCIKMVVHNIDLFLGNLFCAGALRIGFRDALASLLLSVVNVHLLPKQPRQWISMLLRVVHSLACAGYMHEMPVDRRGETRDETRDGATKLVQFRFYRAAFVLYFIPLLRGGACCSGSVTTVFLPEPVTFNRLRLPPPPR